MSRITKKITYNIADRGRKHVGQDRSNVNIRSMVDAINSPATQELVNSGDLYGYYGHELRQLYGMTPPDTVVTQDGREIRIAPAIRTVELSADSNGNVTHRQEFLENETGEYAYQQYKAKVGGFSTAVMFEPTRTGVRNVSGFYGFDYVRTPNYHTNRGDFSFDGLVLVDEAGFDGLEQLDPSQVQLKQVLEQSLVAQYDSIFDVMQAQNTVDYFQQQVIDAQLALDREIMRKRRIAKREADIKQAQMDSLICPSVPFSEFTNTLKAFDSVQLDDDAMKTADTVRNDEMVKAIAQARRSKLGFMGKLLGH